jgi:heat shock protein beta
MRFSTVAVKAVALLALSTNFSGFGPNKGSILVRAEDIDLEDIEDSIPKAGVEENVKDYVPPQNAEKYGFEAEVHRMLDIVVNSLYQHKDVFLRELISNASDALDKIRYLLLTDPDKFKSSEEDILMEIQIEYDHDQKTLTIRDTGVGMTHDEMVSNLGTVARSGTTKFIEALKESGNADATMSQIGQFGVGFYSSFLVADRILVASKSPLDPVQYVWESVNGSGDFFVYEDPRGNTLKRGTEITLFLKDDEYADASKLMSLAKHFSEFVVHPISIRKTETMEVEVDDEDEEGDKEKKEEKDDDDLEFGDEDDVDTDSEEKPKKTKEVTTHTWEVVNDNPAIWTREKEDITEEEYKSFYRLLAGDDTSNAATWTHFNAEGNINFKSILYLPDDIPPTYKYGNMDTVPGALRLYVRKVLIGDDFEFLPKYLGFIRGVVDSDELTLNVNRETLQDNKTLKLFKRKSSERLLILSVNSLKTARMKKLKKWTMKVPTAERMRRKSRNMFSGIGNFLLTSNLVFLKIMPIRAGW